MEDVRLPESTGVVPLSAAHGNELLGRVRSRVSLCRLCHLPKASPGAGEMASSLSHLPLTPRCHQNHRKPANKGGGRCNLQLSSPCSGGEGGLWPHGAGSPTTLFAHAAQHAAR